MTKEGSSVEDDLIQDEILKQEQTKTDLINKRNYHAERCLP